MTKLLKIIGCLVLTGSMFAGCTKDFLNVNPKGFLIAGNTSDYELILNSLTQDQFTGFSHFVMSDEVAGSDIFSIIGSGTGSLSDQMAFKWADDIYQPDINNSEMTPLVKQVYMYNKIINEVGDSKGGTEAQKKMLRAEALVGRSWVNFILVNIYGKPYDAQTAATDLAAPLFKEADVTQTKFTRATVQEMYDQIFTDLTEAIPGLSSRLGFRIRPNQAAGKALLGKVYITQGKFDQALPLLDAFIKDTGNADIPLGLYDYHKEFATDGAFMPIDFFGGPTRYMPTIDKEIAYLRSASNFYQVFYGGVLLSPQTVALFPASDLRLNFFSNAPFASFTPFPAGMLRAWGGGYCSMGISVPDIFLLRAECKSRLGQVEEAASELKYFRGKRMSETDAVIPPAVAGDEVALTTFILEERIREFALKGERWFDMRRLSTDPVYKSTIGTTHNVYDADGNITETYTLKPARLTFRLPLYIMDANPGMPQNP